MFCGNIPRCCFRNRDSSACGPTPENQPPWFQGPTHQVVILTRLRRFTRGENAPWPGKVLLIEPSPDVEVGHLGGANDSLHRLLLPEIVIVRMGDEIVPGGPLAVEITRIGLTQWAQLQIPIVSIVLLELECLVGLSVSIMAAYSKP